MFKIFLLILILFLLKIITLKKKRKIKKEKFTSVNLCDLKNKIIDDNNFSYLNNNYEKKLSDMELRLAFAFSLASPDFQTIFNVDERNKIQEYFNKNIQTMKFPSSIKDAYKIISDQLCPEATSKIQETPQVQLTKEMYDCKNENFTLGTLLNDENTKQSLIYLATLYDSSILPPNTIDFFLNKLKKLDFLVEIPDLTKRINGIDFRNFTIENNTDLTLKTKIKNTVFIDYLSKYVNHIEKLSIKNNQEIPNEFKIKGMFKDYIKNLLKTSCKEKCKQNSNYCKI